MSTPMPPAKMPALAERGRCCMMSGSAGSMPSASAGKQSVTRLIHSRCTGWRMVKPMSVAAKMLMTSLMFEPSRNWMALRMLL